MTCLRFGPHRDVRRTRRQTAIGPRLTRLSSVAEQRRERRTPSKLLQLEGREPMHLRTSRQNDAFACEAEEREGKHKQVSAQSPVN